MDGLTKQVVTLTNKVDALYDIIKQLTHQVTEHLSRSETTELFCKNQIITEYDFPTAVSPTLETLKGSSVEEHKDILIDNEYIETSCYGQELSLTADLQIQRLTAQLTAAYNRIAALEEQLLSKRVHF